MSRIGKKPVAIPSGAKVAVVGREITVEGPKGKLQWKHRPEVAVTVEDDKQVIVTTNDDQRQTRAFHGSVSYTHLTLPTSDLV